MRKKVERREDRTMMEVDAPEGSMATISAIEGEPWYVVDRNTFP